jgi:hypothetical protein
LKARQRTLHRDAFTTQFEVGKQAVARKH